MTTQTNTSPTASKIEFTRVPAMFIQAGFPLKITLYEYAPAAQGLKVLGNKGETLDLSTFLSINRSVGTMILVVQAELKALLTQSASDWENLDLA